MDINLTIFPATTNRESWSQLIGLNDEDTGDPLDLTGLTFACEVRRCGNPPYDSGYGQFYDVGCYNQSPVIALALGSGITVIDVGQLQLDLTVTQMRTLCPATYDIAMVAGVDANSARQIFLGKLPVRFGGVT